MPTLRGIWLFGIMTILAMTSYGSSAQSGPKREDLPDIVKRTQSAAEVFEQIMGAPDKGIPSEILEDAKCVAITPSMFRAAIGFGGAIWARCRELLDFDGVECTRPLPNDWRQLGATVRCAGGRFSHAGDEREGHAPSLV